MNAFELVDIRSHHRCINGGGVSSDQEVIRIDWLSGAFQCRADSAVFDIRGNVER
jgi:hypothetical protein